MRGGTGFISIRNQRGRLINSPSRGCRAVHPLSVETTISTKRIDRVYGEEGLTQNPTNELRSLPALDGRRTPG